VESNKRKDIDNGSGGTRMIAFSTALVFLIVGYVIKGFELDAHGKQLTADRALEARLASVLPKVIQAHASKWNTGVQVAFVHQTAKYSFASGMADHALAKPMTSDTRIAMGSLTKMWTAAHVAQFASAGALTLDEAFVPFVDRYMVSELGQTTAEIYGDWILGVTVRQLLTMRSGLPDYTDTVLRNWTFAGKEYSPFDVLRLSSKTALFAPGTGGAYSSLGYVFLGLVLANLTKSERWSDYDQRSLLPAASRVGYPQTVFPITGLCGEFGTAAMYATDSPAKSRELRCKEPGSLSQVCLNPQPHRIVTRTVTRTTTTRQVQSGDYYGFITNYTCSVAYGSVDARQNSCSNGWTMGNIISTAAEQAEFLHSLYGPGKGDSDTILPLSVKKEMLQMEPLTQGWGTGMPYGMGTYMKATPTDPASDAAWMYGHGGADYGSYTNAHYNPMLEFALVVSTTNESALSYHTERTPYYPNVTSTATNSISNPHAEDAWCAVLDAVLEAFVGFSGGLPAANREQAMAQLGGWSDYKMSNGCYYCRLCEGVPKPQAANAVSTVRRRRRRTTSGFDVNDDDD